MGKEDVPELSDGDDWPEDNDTATAVLEHMYVHTDNANDAKGRPY